MLTVYLVGGDLFAHQAEMGRDVARRRYLHRTRAELAATARRVLGRSPRLHDVGRLSSRSGSTRRR